MPLLVSLLFWNCLLFFHPSLLWLPRLILKKPPSIRFPLTFYILISLDNFLLCFLLCHPGNDKGSYFPFYIHGSEPHVLHFFFFFPANDTVPICPLQDMSRCPYHSVSTSWVKLSTAQWSLGTKSYVTESILFCIMYFTSPKSWSPSPFLLVCPAVKCRSSPDLSYLLCCLLSSPTPSALGQSFLSEPCDPLPGYSAPWWFLQIWMNLLSLCLGLLSSSTCSLPAPHLGWLAD